MKPIISPESSILQEIEGARPSAPSGLLTKNERHRLVEQGFVGLYRWYTARSQQTRNWHPDLSIDWRTYRKDHSDAVHTIIEGFFAVEQFVPDYVTALLKVIRKSHGRSHFHMRWGAEEEKHADLWRNAILFGGKRSLAWTESYMDSLRGQEWALPWDDPLHMLFYTVFQERATQVNYVNLGLLAQGKHPNGSLVKEPDPVLAQMCRIIAVDEAAHYNFFLEGARLFLYYFPVEALEAIHDVIRNFAMPASDIIPDFAQFSEVLHRSSVFGLRQHSRDVVKIALEQLGVCGARELERGIRKSREVPDEFGATRETSILDSLHHGTVERKVRQLFGRIERFEESVGLDEVAPTRFATFSSRVDS